MFSLIKKLKFIGIAAVYSFFSTGVAFADDTEIFFTDNTQEAKIPNILFVIDTSGSMRNFPAGQNQTRLAIVQDAMVDLLGTLTNVNVGLSRFSTPGGPILYPVTYIDTPIEPSIVAPIVSANDDVEEFLPSATNGNMLVDGNILNFDSGNLIGLRFQDIQIPQGAKITSATISVTARQDNTGPSKLLVSGEASDDSVEFNGTPREVSSRPQTVSNVVWEADDWETDATYATPEITEIVQEIVDRNGWCGGNNMSFSIAYQDGSVRGGYTYESDQTFAATLRVKYASELPDGASGCINGTINSQISDNDDDFEFRPDLSNGGNQLNMQSNNDVALRFRNILIPQGATISNAYLRFNACKSQSAGASSVIYGLNVGSAPTTNTDYPATPRTSGVSWAPSAWNEDDFYNSPNISSIVEQIVNGSGWESGNDMGFYIVSSSNERCATTRNDSVSRAPSLVIEYEGQYQSGTLTIREELKNQVRALRADGWTPIADNMLEAGLYFRNEEVLYGRVRGRGPDNDNRVSSPDSYSGGTLVTPTGCTDANPNAAECRNEAIVGDAQYISPITEVCQANHIVFLTDGEPTWMDANTRSIYNRWTGDTCDNTPGNQTNGRGADCAVKIAGFLNNNDQSRDLVDVQTVTTHAIGFDFNSNFLSDMAEAGGGLYKTPDDKAELIAAFQEIIGDILDVNTTFVTSGLTVNQYNRITHLNQLYYSLFKPTTNPRWEGNVKRYGLTGGEVVDINGQPAVDINSGEFMETARSWWSSGTDGNSVVDGGIAEKQQVGRKLYSNLNTGESLTSASNVISEANNLLTGALLNAADDAERKEIIDWALGYDVNDPTRATAHQIIGDPLHSRPTVVAYTVNGSIKTYVFVGTNNGYLHMFDAETGKEQWSFMPKELLGLLKVIKDNNANDQHPYGVDGEITVSTEDTNGNLTVDNGEKAYIYVGMRRGGSSYYALDISNALAPQLLFQPINPQTSPGFAQMGQSWSRPLITKMSIAGQEKRDVMIFGAGYDEIFDTDDVPNQAASVGNTIYIADAKTGQPLWNATMATQAAGAGPLSAMSSIPGNIKAFDLDGDKLIDHFYAADMAGQIFRFDVNNDTQQIKGGRIADLQQANTPEDNRRFYNAPDTALIRDPNTGETYVSIAIGSGFRAHPLDTLTNEHMYVIQDKGILSGTFFDTKISDLVEISANMGDTDGDGISDVAELINDDQSPKKGWYLDFPTNGEKVLAESLTFNNSLLFTTYIPPSESTSACDPASGTSRIYALSLVDGQPYVDVNFDGDIDQSDMFIRLPGAGIAPEPQVILTQEGSLGTRTNLCVGRNCGLDNLLSTPPQRMMPIKWRHLNN
ncbi:MAG: hypothetical protein V2I33_09290 [Kangiellaceae bacterium]|jgi:type IV pilus assembly protein PilY1|nr:hypothetical protein [Kangiellaceae bacterium]